MKKVPSSSKKFYKEDFEEQFGIPYLSHNKLQAQELAAWDVTLDREYTVNPKLNTKLTEK